MIAQIITLSVRHRFIVLLLGALLVVAGVWGYRHIRLDAIPDLSDVQVIVVTEFPGQNPQVVDDQITYPLSSALLSVPGATDVRGTSMFELSFVYVLFEDGTDIYWARARVLEYLSTVRDRLPAGVQPKLGPDATGVGWVYQYALRSDRHDLAELRALQDYYLRYPLTAVAGVSEVASFGGFVKQYEVTLDPYRLQGFGLSIGAVREAIERSNNDVGGAVVERAEQELMVRSRGYVQGIADLERVAVGAGRDGTPILLRDVAAVVVGGESRRGVGELNGEGEAVGGIVVARFGANAYEVIGAVKDKLQQLGRGLPAGVTIVPTYDRSAVIGRAVATLRSAVLEELLVVGAICLLFLAHVRSALVALGVLPIGLLASLLVMTLLGINANIMSLGGLALAIGVMVDASVVMVENAHKHLALERERVAAGGVPRPRADIVLAAACEVGPSLFSSMLVITVAFLPIFVLGGESGRMFEPLAWTKTFAIATGALLGITVVPVLMVYFVRGRIPREERNPINRLSMAVYEPLFWMALRHPRATLLMVVLLGASTWYPLSRLGSEFMPKLDEGDLLYMPTTPPSVSIAKSKELLQQTDKLIKTFPEVVSVHGKIGRADTATDPAPLSMLETVVQLEPERDKWRQVSTPRFYRDWPDWLQWPFAHTLWPPSRPLTIKELQNGWIGADGRPEPGLDQVVGFPGVANAWPYPIENRINMLATGIKTPVGIKLFGPDRDQLLRLATRCAAALLAKNVSGTRSATPDITGVAYYLDIDIDREAIARFGATVGDVQDVIQSAVGGMAISTAVEGPGRYPIALRYPRELRGDEAALRAVLVPTMRGVHVPLGELAAFHVTPTVPMLRSENAAPTAWVYVDVVDRDLGSYVAQAEQVLTEQVPLPAGYTRAWAGTFVHLAEARDRLLIVVPVVLGMIVLLLYAAAGSWFRVGVILLAVPFSLIGAFWFLYALDYDMSLAVWVGIIALLGVDAETGQMMLLYLDKAFEQRSSDGRMRHRDDLLAAIHEGAVQRIRPKTMTVATDMIGLLPLLWATGTGADVTRRLVAPLIGGISVSFLMELLVYPVVFYLAKSWQLRRTWQAGVA